MGRVCRRLPLRARGDTAGSEHAGSGRVSDGRHRPDLRSGVGGAKRTVVALDTNCPSDREPAPMLAGRANPSTAGRPPEVSARASPLIVDRREPEHGRAEGVDDTTLVRGRDASIAAEPRAWDTRCPITRRPSAAVLPCLPPPLAFGCGPSLVSWSSGGLEPRSNGEETAPIRRANRLPTSTRSTVRRWGRPSTGNVAVTRFAGGVSAVACHKPTARCSSAATTSGGPRGGGPGRRGQFNRVRTTGTRPPRQLIRRHDPRAMPRCGGWQDGERLPWPM